MEVQIDSREHKSELERIQRQFDRIGIKYFVSKLFVGDYMNLDNPRLVVDRKKDLLEICNNVTKQHERFKAELLRAKEHGIKIVVLCENGEGVEKLEDVYFWENPRAKPSRWVMRDGHPVKVAESEKATDGKTLHKCLQTISERYDVEFLFCNKRDTGRRIAEILGGGTDGK